MLPDFMCPGIWAIHDPYMASASFGPFSTEPSMPSNKSTVAVIGVHGVLRPRGGWYNDSAEEVSHKITQAANDPNIKTVVFDFNTPGGYIAGIPELAGQIRDLGKQKHTVGVVNHMAASAGYWLASQTNTINASPAAMVGSIGVISTHMDVSKRMEEKGYKVTHITSAPRKAEANPYEPLSPAAKSSIQAEVDHYHSMFVEAVAKGRGVDPSVVSQKYGQGAAVNAHAALAAGMIDGIKSLGDTLAELDNPDRSARQRSMFKAEMDKQRLKTLLNVTFLKKFP